VRPGGNAPAPAGEVRSAAEVQGQTGTPVPAGVNDSGPQARLGTAGAPAAPAPSVNPTTRPPQGGANPGARP
jgi:hypothetical protein